MAIRERVKPAKTQEPAEDREAAELAVIGKGAAAKADGVPPAPESADPAEVIAKFTFRVPRDVLEAIEADAKAERPKVSVNNWIYAAVLERLERRRGGKD
jgi:predicted HicB family RNase H-like nuclease